MRYFIFSLIFLGLLFLFFKAHFVILNFINKISFVKKNIFIYKKIFLFLCWMSILSFFLRIKFNYGILEYVFILGFYWAGVVIILLFWCIIGEVFLFLLKRRVKQNIVVCIFLFISLFCIIKSTYDGIKLPKFNEIILKYNHLKKDYKIIFITDLHLSSAYKTEWFIKLYDKIKNSYPDILILGGDILEFGYRINEKIIEKVCSSKIPTIVVFGNHEYYFGLNQSIKIFNQLNFEILRNSSLVLDELNFIGLGDIITENLSKQQILDILSKHYRKDKINILISHQPLFFEEISKKFDVIMLSGHIHKGQIFPFHIFVRVVYKYFYGLYKKYNSVLYVSSGGGVWGPPMRFFAEPEIVKIILKR